jgi:hypothetical protein
MRQPLIIKVCDMDGLCNRLFPFAHLITCAQEHQFRVRHAAFSEFSEFFEGTASQLVPSFPGTTTSLPDWLRRKVGKVFGCVQRILKKLRPQATMVLGDQDTCDVSAPEILQAFRANKTTWLSGLYYYDSRSFQKHAALVRAFFRPVESVRQLVSASVLPARDSTDILVGVHIRHGDYVTFCNGIMFYTFAEYAQLMQIVRGLFPEKRVSFLVCSNATLPMDEFAGLRVHVGPGHFVGDLYALASCDYIMGPPSTFSEWASFYGQVPRYMHRAKDYEWNNQAWPGVSLQDFVVHADGFARCAQGHPASLVNQ